MFEQNDVSRVEAMQHLDAAIKLEALRIELNEAIDAISVRELGLKNKVYDSLQLEYVPDFREDRNRYASYPEPISPDLRIAGAGIGAFAAPTIAGYVDPIEIETFADQLALAGTAVFWAIVGGLIGAFVFYAVGISVDNKRNAEVDERNAQERERQIKQYQAKLDKAKQNLESRRKRVAIEKKQNKQIIRSLGAKKDDLEIVKSSVERLLEQHYSADIVHPSFRNIYSLVQLLERFETKEANSISDAYRSVRDSKERKAIQGQLSQLVTISQLMNANLGRVLCLASEMNDNVSKMRSDLDSGIRRLDEAHVASAATAFCAAKTAEAVDQLRQLEEYQNRYRDIPVLYSSDPELERVKRKYLPR